MSISSRLERKKFQTVVCMTDLHKEMLEQVLDVFGVVPNYNLDNMKSNQTLYEVAENVLKEMKDS